MYPSLRSLHILIGAVLQHHKGVVRNNVLLTNEGEEPIADAEIIWGVG
jgi:hypothetical protein